MTWARSKRRTPEREPVDEAELIGAAQSGDREAFDELVRRTFVDTFTLARRLTGNEEDARDVVQDAYLRAWRGIGKFRGEAAVLDVDVPDHRERRRHPRAQAPPPARPSRSTTIVEPADDRRRGAARGGGRVGRRARTDRASRSTSCRRSCGRVVVLKDVYGLLARGDRRGARYHRCRRRRCGCTGPAGKLRDVLYEEGAEAHAV